MNKFITSAALLTCFFSNSLSQTLLEENFDYPAGNSLTNHGWSIVQGGTDVTTVSASGLSYTGYLSSGIGNAALLNQNSGGGHEDLGKSFTSQTSGNVYVSFLINASDVDNTASFNFPLYVSASSGTGGWGRVYIDIDNDSNLRFGLGQFTESAVYTGFTYALNTTYLIVLKYTINPGDNNDEASLFVFTDPTLPASEPGSPTLGPVASTSSDPAQIARVIIRRAAGSNNDLLLDGIRVSTSWSEAPLPVELVSFTSSVRGNKVTLSWSTASETNNYGFEVERKHESSSWGKISFIAGNGTTTVPRNYSFVDERLTTGSYAYRLKQLDTDGQFEYSDILNVTVSLPLTTRLVQNYPNPFNPSTNIVYSIENQGLIQLMILDISGRTVRTLVNESRLPGEYSVLWNGRNDHGKRVASGIYFYSLQVGSQATETKQMVMLK